MTLKELALTRESCRSYKEAVVSHDELKEIMETACLSPSACNSQPWRLVAAEGEKAKEVSAMIQKSGRNHFVEEASAFIAICEMPAVLRPGVCFDQQHFAQMDVGMVTMLLTLAAADKGLSTCILGCFDEEGVKAALKIPAEIPLRLIVAVGHAKEEGVRDKIRKPKNETICFNEWA